MKGSIMIISSSKLIKRTFSILLITSLLFLSGCGSKQAETIPFTEIYFDSSVDDIFALEGNNYDSYDSIYEGTTYIYSKEYLGKTGTIKYMTDSDSKIQNVAWNYTSDDEADITAAADLLYNDLVEKYGEPKHQNGTNNYSEIWKRKSGNIILSIVITSDTKTVQVAFLSPKVSSPDK